MTLRSRINALENVPIGEHACDAIEHVGDPALGAIVREAASQLEMPVALITVLLQHVQYYLAHHGLDADLAAAGAIDRDLSFCQFVVRDRDVFEVCDASTDMRVPHELVVRRGIGAYLGMPLVVGDEVIGSLCVTGGAPRTFGAEDRAFLSAMARRASVRLSELIIAPRQSARALVRAAAQPAFAELANALSPLHLSIKAARVAMRELSPIARLADHVGQNAEAEAFSILTSAGRALADLERAHGRLAVAAERVEQSVQALETLILPPTTREPCADWLLAADRVARHATKLVGVALDPWPPGVRVRAPRTVTVATISAALSTVALAAARQKHPAPVQLRIELDEGRLVLRCSADGVSGAELAESIDELGALTGGEDGVHVRADGESLRIELARAS